MTTTTKQPRRPLPMDSMDKQMYCIAQQLVAILLPPLPGHKHRYNYQKRPDKPLSDAFQHPISKVTEEQP